MDETSGQLPIIHPLEAGDHSVHGGNRQTRTALYAHIAQQQQQLTAAGVQQEHGGAVRGSNAAAAALQLAQVGTQQLFVYGLHMLCLLPLLLMRIQWLLELSGGCWSCLHRTLLCVPL